MRILARAPRLLIAVGLLSIASRGIADTSVGGTISTDTTWHQVDSPFVLTSTVFVEGAASPTLTIEAGVTVKIPSGMGLYIGNAQAGNLIAVGSAGSPITFTSTGATTAGSWESVRLMTHAGATTHLSFVTVKYAGQNGWPGINVDTSSPAIDNCTVQNNAVAGVWIRGASSATLSTSTISNNPTGILINTPATPSLTTLTISNNTGFAISMDSKVTLTAASGVTATGNGTNGVQVNGNVDVTTTWKKFGLTYYPSGQVWVSGATTPILTIKPGITVKFPSGGSFIVGNGSLGNLQAVGTSASPITITTTSGTPVAGSFEGIRFYSQTVAASKVQYATLSYAGQNGFGGVYIDTCSPTIDNSTIQTNATAGIRIVGTASPTISNSTITGNPTGISITYPATPTLTTLAITNNTGFPISMDAKITLPSVSGITATGNGTNGLQLNGNVDITTTWKNFGLVYYPSGQVWVSGAATPILTLQAGLTVKFPSGGSFIVGNGSPGNLQAVGTSASPITITTTSGTPVAGSLEGIRFYNQTVAASKVQYVTLSYAGQNGFGGVYIDTCSPTIDNATIQNNATAGVRVVGTASPTISNSTITGNPTGISVSYPATPSLTTLTISNNAGFPIVMDSKVTLPTVSGITATGNGTNGVQVSGNVDVTTTWKNFGLVYYPTGQVWVSSATTPVLTVTAGLTVKFPSSGSFIVGNGSPGNLQAVGTASQPITITTTSGTPVPGSFEGIRFYSQTVAASKVQYATVSYAGQNGFGGVYIDTCSPTIDNTTIQNAANQGLRVVGTASPTVSNSTITGSPTGISISYPAAPSLTTLTVSNNTGFAFVMDAKVTLPTVSGITATGNGTNGVQVNGNVDVTTTWKKFGLTYYPSGQVWVSGATTPILTINPGVTVKFPSGGSFIVGNGSPGNLQAVGTSASPITITTTSGTPVAGSFEGFRFYSQTVAASKVQYATLSYAGQDGFGGIYVNLASPTIDHVTLQNNAIAGIRTDGGSPTITNCNFSGNTIGLSNTTPTIPIIARRNYWNSLDGPFGTGGQGVSTGVLYDPWLGTAASSPNFFNAFTLGNTTFNPTLSINANFSFTTTQSGNWTLKVYNASSALIRTISGTGTSGSPVWDGKNDSGTLQPDGAYTYQADSTAGANVAAPVRGKVTINSTLQLTISNVAITPPFFSPNGDGVQDTTTFTAQTSFDGANWTVTVKKPNGNTVRTGTGTTTSGVSYTWDGKNGSGVVQADAVYTFNLTVTDGTSSANASISGTLDNTPPTASLTIPADGGTVSNVYANGSTDVVVTGSVADLNFSNWTTDYGAGANPTSFNPISSGTAPVTNGPLGTWATGALTNGLYTVRLQAFDKAGNKTVVSPKSTVGNFSLLPNVNQLNSVTGESATLTSIVPFSLTETIVLKNAAGGVARTLLNGVLRPAATYNDVWNDRSDAGTVLPDGPYFSVATVTDGTHTLVYDLTTTSFIDDGYQYGVTTGTSYDFFNNKPLTFTYNFSRPGRVSIGLAPTADPHTGCPPPEYCVLLDKYEESGLHTVYFGGADPSGRYVADAENFTAAWSLRSNFAKNAIVLYGTKPVITNLTLTPAMYGPDVSDQDVEFDLATYLNQNVTITLTFVNQASVSALRTVTLTNHAPGHVLASWDGLADNGMWVAPGFYTCTVTVTDSIGNSSSSQLMTTILY